MLSIEQKLLSVTEALNVQAVEEAYVNVLIIAEVTHLIAALKEQLCEFSPGG